MARRATIIGATTDYRGRAYDVREARPTPHGFDVLIGWPAGHRGKGTQGPQVIATRPLVDLLLANAHQPAIPPLPIGKTAAKRVRKLLGINRYTSIADWWARQGPPGTLADAAAALGRTPSAVSQQERRQGKRRVRPAGWWRQEPARTTILTQATSAAAKSLGVAAGSIRRMRCALKQSGPLTASKATPRPQ